MKKNVLSKNQVPIRLTDERWSHIIEEHCELAGMKTDVLEAVSHPDFVVLGKLDELLACKKYKDNKYIVIVYKEEKKDGFIITAFLTSRLKSLKKRKQIWPLH